MIDLFAETLYSEYLFKKEGVKSCNNTYSWEDISDLYELYKNNKSLKSCNLQLLCEEITEVINTL